MTKGKFRGHTNTLVRSSVSFTDSTDEEKDQLVETLNTLIEPTNESPKEVEVVVVGCDRLNVREAPSKESKSLETLKVKTHLVVEMLDEEWAAVKTINGFVKSGYVMRSFLKEI